MARSTGGRGRHKLNILAAAGAAAAVAAVAAVLTVGGATAAPTAVIGTPRAFAVTRGVPFTTVVATFTDDPLGDVRDVAAYVDRAFSDLLGRAADPFGAAYWTSRIEAGIGRPVLPPALVGTTEWGTHEVVALYEDPDYLNRTPSGEEASYWGSLVTSGGTSLTSLRAIFLGSPEFVDAHGGTANAEAVVDGLYRAALGRPADADGRAYFAGLLRSGTSATTIANNLLRSSEGLGHLVSLRWFEFLGRAASPGEQGAWIPTVTQPTGERTLLVALAACQEYFDRLPSDYAATVKWGSAAAVPATLRRAGGNVVQVVATRVLTVNADDLAALVVVTRTGDGPTPISSTVDVLGSRNERYLGGLYTDALGRGLDESGRDFWLPRIASGGTRTRGSIARAVVGSAEWDAHEATVLAQDPLYLGRTPTSSEVASWAAIVGSQSADALRSLLLSSDEYYNAHGATPESYVDALFVSVMHRAADPDGRAYFVSLLQQYPRSVVTAVMIASREGRVAQARDLYSTYLHRTAGDGEANAMADVLTANPLDFAIAAITVSQEYYDKFPLADGS